MTEKFVPFGDRELEGHGIRLEDVTDHGHALAKVGARPIHLVDEGDPRYAIPVGLPPDSFRLRLHPFYPGEKGYGAIENPQRAAYLNSEVYVARGVDYVDAVIFPKAGRRGRSNGDASLLLLFHPVHGGGTLVDFPDPVIYSCIVQDPFCRSCFSGVYVGHDTDVSCPDLHFFTSA